MKCYSLFSASSSLFFSSVLGKHELDLKPGPHFLYVAIPKFKTDSELESLRKSDRRERGGGEGGEKRERVGDFESLLFCNCNE